MAAIVCPGPFPDKLIVWQLSDGKKLFEIPVFKLVTPWELIPYFGLGLLSGMLAPEQVVVVTVSTPPGAAASNVVPRERVKLPAPAPP